MSYHTHFMSSLFNFMSPNNHFMSEDIHFMSRLVYFMSPCTTRVPHILLTWGAWDRQADGQAVVCWHRHPQDVVADMMEDDSMAGQFQGRYAPDTVTDRFGASHRIFASVSSGLWMQHWTVKRGGGSVWWWQCVSVATSSFSQASVDATVCTCLPGTGTLRAEKTVSRFTCWE